VIHWRGEDSRHAFSGDIADGFFGERASASRQGLEGRQSKPAAFVACGDCGRDEPRRCGPDRGHGSPDGSRPRQPADQRYESAYLFGAICPSHAKGAALALPLADTYAMQLHLDEISRHVAAGAHPVLLMDRAGWHTTANPDVPDNISPIFLPSRAPELNPVEKVWQYLRANWLSNRVFLSKPPARPGEGSSTSPRQSHQSDREPGRTSVNPNAFSIIVSPHREE
jgi:transposase